MKLSTRPLATAGSLLILVYLHEGTSFSKVLPYCERLLVIGGDNGE
jgi:hypothetical protein